MQTCPDCKGRRTLLSICGGVFWCFTCHGHGEVTDDYEARYQEARRIRNDRLARGETVRSEAKRLGMSAVEYSKVEHPAGNDLPYPDHAAAAEATP